MRYGRINRDLSRIALVFLLALLAKAYFATTTSSPPQVIKEGEKTYIVDRTGEHWDVTQAISLGFSPDGFEHGLGRKAFVPLDDSFLTEDAIDVPGFTRVEGRRLGHWSASVWLPTLLVNEISNFSHPV